MLHITKVKPMFTSIVTTADRFEEDYTEGGIVVFSRGSYKPWQTILAVGTSIRDLKEGDKVMINLDNYAVKRYNKDSLQNDMDNNKTIKYMFNFIQMDDDNGNPRSCFLLNDRDVFYTFEGEEKTEAFKMPKTKIIV